MLHTYVDVMFTIMNLFANNKLIIEIGKNLSLLHVFNELNRKLNI